MSALAYLCACMGCKENSLGLIRRRIVRHAARVRRHGDDPADAEDDGRPKPENALHQKAGELLLVLVPRRVDGGDKEEAEVVLRPAVLRTLVTRQERTCVGGEFDSSATHVHSYP